MSKSKLDMGLFEGFTKKQAPIQKVVASPTPSTANIIEEKETSLMLLVPEDFKEKLELYKIQHKKKSLKAVIIELVGPAVGYTSSI